MHRLVEFTSEGATLRGRLLLPAEGRAPLPAVVMAHGFSATIDGMVADRYGSLFAEAGFAVLLYDHRGFGISGGEPRQEIDRWVQARGYRDAIAHLASLPGIDPSRIAVWGDSLSGAEALAVAGVDPHVNAVIVQVPACGDDPPPADEAAVFEAMRRGLIDVCPPVAASAHGPRPVVSCDQIGTPSHLTPLTAFRWFIEYGGRHGTNWVNWATRVSRTALWHPAVAASRLTIPSLFVIAPDDEMPGSRPAVSLDAYRRAPGAELMEIGGGHFGLLHYPSVAFDRAAGVQRDFLIRHLA
jgi:uncharacterized protein